MSHMVEKVGERYAIAYAGEVPWHGLGKSVLGDLTPEQMLKEALLDWTVERRPCFINWKKERLHTGLEALVRSSDGKVLTHISSDWKEVQNHEAFEFFNDFVMAGDMSMHTAGSLREGKMVWALAKVNEGFELFGGDKVESYLLFSLPHEYGKCIDIRFTPIRVVCNNTLTLSLGGKTDMMVRLNHRRKFDAEMVKKTLGIAHSKLGSYKEMAEFLGKKKYKPEALAEYFTRVFPSTSAKDDKKMSRPAKIAFDVVDHQPGADYARGSWWQAANATSFAIDHVLGHNTESRLYSSWYGSNRKKKVEALELACEYAEAA